MKRLSVCACVLSNLDLMSLYGFMYENVCTHVQYVCEDSSKITVCEFYGRPEGIEMHTLMWVSRVWAGTVLQVPSEMLISFITCSLTRWELAYLLVTLHNIL